MLFLYKGIKVDRCYHCNCDYFAMNKYVPDFGTLGHYSASWLRKSFSRHFLLCQTARVRGLHTLNYLSWNQTRAASGGVSPDFSAHCSLLPWQAFTLSVSLIHADSVSEPCQTARDQLT